MASGYRDLFKDEDFCWQEWTGFNVATLETIDDILRISSVVNENDVTNIFRPYGALGCHRVGGAGSNERGSWSSLIKPNSPYFIYDSDNLDTCHTCAVFYNLAVDTWIDISRTIDQYTTFYGMKDPQSQSINWNYVTGQKVNQLDNWDPYPIREQSYWPSEQTRVSDGFYYNAQGWPIASSFPDEFYIYLKAWTSGSHDFYRWADVFFDYGFLLHEDGGYQGASWQGPDIGEIFKMTCQPTRVKIYYCNAVVNSLSHYQYDPSSNEDFTLNGLGFHIPEATLAKYGVSGGGWGDETDYINFIGQQGQGTYQVYKTNFSVATNTQITIPGAQMPSLPNGTYKVQVEKSNNEKGTTHFKSIAGAYRADSTGRISPGTEFLLFVGPGIEDGHNKIIYSKWGWKSADGTIINAYYSEIDARAPNVFYDGRITSLGSLTRSVNQESGLATISDLEVDLANDDLEFSKKLASYFLKNQIVQFWRGYIDEPEGWKEDLFTGIVEDYDLIGNNFRVYLKDITQKYFDFNIPLYRITADEYPNAPEGSLGLPMPEVLGYAPLTNDETPGAVEAILVDSTTNKYLAARGSLKEITAVYSDATFVNDTLYTIQYADGGRTYIVFDNDQEDNKITFNCKGYFYSSWDSSNGYVENPIYIILFFLAFLCEIPQQYLNISSFDDLAELFEDRGLGTNGFLILQDERSVNEVLGELCGDRGVFVYPANDGRYMARVKDLTDFDTNTRIWSQIDLVSHVERKFNMRDLFNFINAKWGYCPTASLFYGAKEYQRAQSKTYYESNMARDFEFKWVKTEAAVSSRVEDLFNQFANGNREILFTLPGIWAGVIDLLDNFGLQDLFGIAAGGGGESTIYAYIRSLTYNFDSDTISLICKDLNYLLAQFAIVGADADLPDDWASATLEQRFYWFLADATGFFDDGEPCKKLISIHDLEA